jgi:hypothetical protein
MLFARGGLIRALDCQTLLVMRNSMKLANILLIGLLFPLLHVGAQTPSVVSPTGVLMQGKVVYPDGSAARGARIFVESNCTDTTVHLAQETIADLDGEFSMKSFDPACGKYRFFASHREAFWLPTRDHVFYEAPNGTTPTIELMAGQMPSPILIRLEQRGGEVELRAFDEATQSYIYAGLDIRREPVAEKTFGGRISTATRKDGSSHTLFLPPGSYVAEVSRYKCQGRVYFSAKPPTFRFSIKAGERQALTMKMNIADLEAKPSYDNPKAERCSR